jgi:hypothetical protein
LIGFILDAPTYLLDYGYAFVPFPHPGPPPLANALVGTWKVYDLAMSNWKCENAAIKSLMTNIFRSLDRVALSLFFDPLRNRYNMDPTNFFAVMFNSYGLADTEVITRWVNLLQAPMDPTCTIRDLVSSQRDLHTKLNMARGYVIHADEAVRGLLQATRFSPLRPAIITWLTEHRGAANQDFEALATYLCDIELVTASLSAPTTGPLYAGLQANLVTEFVPQVNAVTASKVITNANLLHANENILKAIQNLVLTSRGQPTKSTSRIGSATQGTTATRAYCWTHGIFSH